MRINSRYDLLYKKPSFYQYRQKMLSHVANMLLRNTELDNLKVKHLEIISKNTLSTPKVALVESGLDPANNGEITMNSGIIRGKSNSVVKNFGGVLANETSLKVDFTTLVGGQANGWSSPTTGGDQSVTVTPASVPNYVHVIAAMWTAGINNTSGGTSTLNIKNGSTVLVTEAQTFSNQTPHVIILDYLDSNVSSATYTANGVYTGVNFGSVVILAKVLKI